MSLQQIMEVYRNFLNSALPVLVENFNDDFNSIVDDWLQSNWEIIVEYCLTKTIGDLVVVQEYGSGADCNKHSRRVWMPEYTATHRIVCRLQKTGYVLKFQNFVGLDEFGRYESSAPFTHVECAGYVFVAVDDCDFELQKLSS